MMSLDQRPYAGASDVDLCAAMPGIFHYADGFHALSARAGDSRLFLAIAAAMLKLRHRASFAAHSFRLARAR